MAIDNDALLINLIGIDQRNRNAIEMILKKKQSGLCVLSDADDASLSIVDLDKFGAADEWLALQQIKPDQLAILLSINDTNRTPGHLFIKKPASITDLIDALNSARNKLASGNFFDQKKQPDWNKLFSTGLKKSEKTGSSKPETNDAVTTKKKEISFLSEHGYLIEEVKMSVVQANSEGHGIRLQINKQGNIFIDPAEHWINTDLTSEILKKLCCKPLKETEVIKYVFSDRDFSRYLEEWRDSRLKSIDIDAFLWDLSLWTYRGSLPENTDLSKKIILSYWPDLPRLTPIENSIRISALWVSCPMTLAETADVLKIPIEDVINFYVAANTLGLVNQSNQVARQSKESPDQKTVIKSDKKQREFYLRILRHLKRHNLNG